MNPQTQILSFKHSSIKVCHSQPSTWEEKVGITRASLPPIGGFLAPHPKSVHLCLEIIKAMWPPLWALQLHVHFPPLDRIGDRLKWLVFAIQFDSHCQVSGSELICESYQGSKSRFFFFFLSSHVDPPNPCYFLHKNYRI